MTVVVEFGFCEKVVSVAEIGLVYVIMIIVHDVTSWRQNSSHKDAEKTHVQISEIHA